MAVAIRPPRPSEAPAGPGKLCECAPHPCTFSAPRVRWYLYVWRQAQLAHEPFSEVLRSESRNSRDVDPWIKGGRIDQHRAQDIGLALEMARDEGGLVLHPCNADLIADYLCGRREVIS